MMMMMMMMNCLLSTVGLTGPVSLVDICFAPLTNHASHCRILYIIYRSNLLFVIRIPLYPVLTATNNNIYVQIGVREVSNLIPINVIQVVCPFRNMFRLCMYRCNAWERDNRDNWQTAVSLNRRRGWSSTVGSSKH